MARPAESYVWFDDVRVAMDGLWGLHCIVGGQRVPLPISILHPDCTLREAGDVGRLGVPLSWAIGFRLSPHPDSA